VDLRFDCKVFVAGVVVRRTKVIVGMLVEVAGSLLTKADHRSQMKVQYAKTAVAVMCHLRICYSRKVLARQLQRQLC
jgi:hypothetical protein